MKIDDDHMYHGAALLQITEHPTFTAINSMEVSGQRSRSAYRINDSIGIFLKYASKPSRALGEYPFTFASSHLQELDAIASQAANTFIALVCVKDREIACLQFRQLQELVKRRQKKKGTPEEQYVVLVTAPQGKNLRVYVNMPGRRKLILGNPLLIPRRSFPDVLFVGSDPD